jgi:hypothetical protein
MDRRNDGVRLRRQEAIDQVRAGEGLRLRASITSELGPDAAEGEQRSFPFSANHTTPFFLVSGFASGAYSAKLLAGTRQRLSGLSQARQCGDDVLRMFLTG